MADRSYKRVSIRIGSETAVTVDRDLGGNRAGKRAAIELLQIVLPWGASLFELRQSVCLLGISMVGRDVL